MGCSKLTLEVDGEPIIHRVVRSMVEGDASPVVIVLGNHADLVSSALDGQPVLKVTNPDPSRGMLSSVQEGIRALPDDLDGFLVCPGDIALMTPEIVRALLNVASTRSEPILVPTYQGKRGHPVYLSSNLRGEVLALPLTVGLNFLLEQSVNEVGEVEVEDQAVLVDVDTPEDWTKLAGQAENETLRT
jgi:molybdenum cofactor cytidylyltransferase